jgi:3-deoxy-manno-octulosonate cytidylyltransferase (CMP-KDO synthetase)
MAVSYITVIPARFKSSRFPGKPLIDLNGKSMIQRTYEQCLKAFPKKNIFVATENNEIKTHCELLGINVLMTSDSCLTGTDRIAEVSRIIDVDYYINVQGDEPLFNPEDLKKLLVEINKNEEQIINGYCPINDEEDFFSKSIPKVVMRPDGRLLYMSRSPIPGNKSGEFNLGYRQVCAYAFPRKPLIEFASRKIKTPLEFEEDIEILRFLELGYEVKMIEMSNDSIAIDNPQDVQKVLKRINHVS